MKIYENILKGKVKYPAYVNSDAQDLLQRLITADLTKRLGNLYGGSQDVKNHQWFSEVTWDRLSRKDIDAPYMPPVKAGGRRCQPVRQVSGGDGKNTDRRAMMSESTSGLFAGCQRTDELSGTVSFLSTFE